MKTLGKRIGGCAALLALGASLVAGVLTLPKPVSHIAAAEGNADLAATYARNEKLVVKYGLDEVKEGKLSAYKWDTETKTYVADPAADATVVYEQDGKATGTVNKVEGVEGGSALSFSGIAHGRASVHLPQDAEGMTISIWVKNLSTYWGSLAEFWDGTKGGRFGKGTLQLSQGNPFTWGYPVEGNGDQNGNCPSYDSAKCEGTKHSFVTSIDSWDSGGDAEDLMAKEQWYQVTYTVTETELKAYRDGELKQTFKLYREEGQYGNNVNKILSAIMTAAKNQTSGMFGLRLGNDDTGDRADILDDYRIYSGAMSEEDVAALYKEYKGIKAIHGKTVKLEGETSEYSADNGGSIRFTSDAEPFPKILIGGVEAANVTEAEGVYSAAGDGFNYTYTVGELAGNVRTATVTYTAGSDSYVFEVTQTKKKVVKLSSLKLKINDGEAEEIEGFKPETTEYEVTLSPDTYKVEFEATVEDGGSSNLAEVNAAIDYNGNNVITTQAAAEGAGEGLSYTVTLKRERADTAPPAVKGLKLDYAAQVVYTDELPASIAEEDVVPVYPNGVTVEAFSYDSATHVLTFTLKDKVTSDTTAYQVSYKAKKEGQAAHWSFDESSDNKTFEGLSWDSETNGLKKNDTLDMTVRQSEWNVSVSESRPATAATVVDGVSGNGIELPAWGYTTASVPAMGGVTGFTFSTWMKMENPTKPWEAVFVVLGETHGVIFEKGTMQWHVLDGNGNPNTGWGNLSNSEGVWTGSSLGDETAKSGFFNTPTSGGYVFYTVTVTYVNGTGRVLMYKDGELAVTFEDDPAVTEKAKIAVEAFNAGAKIGLRRHHLDGEYKTRFDETDIYAYAMTAEEVKASYNTIAEFLAAAPAYYDAEGLTYPDLLLGGAKSVTAEGENKKGVTESGIEYTYKPVEAPATAEKDEAGVTVTLQKNGMTRTATVKFRRTLNVEAEKLGYKIGTGENVPLEVPENAANEIVVRLPAGTDRSTIAAGENAVKKIEGDSGDDNYAATFTYNQATHVATVRCSYTLFPAFDRIYTIRFETKSEETFLSMQVTGGKSPLTLTPADFGTDVEVAVESLTSFSLTVRLTLAAGAAGTAERVYTQADLEGGKLKIEVTNENGETKAYYLKPVALSSEASLSALSAGTFSLSPAFSATETEYTVTVNKGQGEEVFKALTFTAASGGTAEKVYDVGSHKITVTVTSADGSARKVYTVTLAELDTDAALSGITVGGKPLEGFDPDKTAYTVKYKGTLPEVNGTPRSSSADVAVSQPQNGTVKITVTAKSGDEKEYTVTLVQMSADASLTKLTLNGVEIAITDGAGSYTAPAGVSLGQIAVYAEVAEGASYTYKAEQSSIVITVTAEDGTQKTYTVAVTFSAPTPAGDGTEDNSPKEGCGGVLGGAGIAAAIALLAGAGLAVSKKRKG